MKKTLRARCSSAPTTSISVSSALLRIASHCTVRDRYRFNCRWELPELTSTPELIAEFELPFNSLAVLPVEGYLLTWFAFMADARVRTRTEGTLCRVL
jgi:hypothetical protein